MDTSISTREAIELGAVDSEFFYREFFPRTFRQEPPEFHRHMDSVLDSSHRLVGFKCFRGAAKTTKFRGRAARQISYGLSNTIIFVSNAQKHSGYSLKWLRRQVEANTKWASAFELTPGRTWNDEHIEIMHGHFGTSINVLSLGITGQVRGINLDDYRPDLVFVDDPDNEETTATPDQREKTQDLIFGALENSLAPPSDSPGAKMVVGQTPFNNFDTITTMAKREDAIVLTYGCFDIDGNSQWETRYSTQYLRNRKEGFIRLNKLSLWMREMECKIVSKESSSFDHTWLKFYEHDDEIPKGGRTVIAIDPASSESKRADDQVVGAVTQVGSDVYLRDYTANRGENPEAAAMTFFSYMDTYRPFKGVVESISYQRVLKWYIEKKMHEVRKWLVVNGFQDRRKKSDRIVQTLSGLAAHGHLYCKPGHTKFIEQFATYSPLIDMHDDVLDMTAIAVMELGGLAGAMDDYEHDFEAEERDIPALTNWRHAP